MFKIIEPLSEYTNVIQYSFSIELDGYICAGMVRSASAFGDIECENTIIWDIYHPNFPRLTEEQEGELIEQLFATLNNSY